MKKLFLILACACLACVVQAGALAQSITSQPQSLARNSGSTAVFTVGATGAASYQWQFNGTNLSDGTNISGSATSSLMVEDLTTNEAGSYSVVVNNSETSSNAELTVIPGTVVTLTITGYVSNGMGTNVQVELFNQDKPATVENFLHYIASGAYSNMFFDFCSPHSRLEGGNYGTSNVNDTNPPPYGWNILTHYTNETPPFPAQIDSEFGVGPLIHNRAGTIAMALPGGRTNAATSAFFLNLADNTASFDPNGYTVFGRVVVQTNNENAGTNALNYFYGLKVGSGILATNIFSNGVSQLTLDDVPVNYIGTNPAGNANLVFCDFQLPTNAPVDTNPPTVAISSPGAPALLTNGLQGSASDDVGLALVACALVPQRTTNGVYPYPYHSTNTVTNYAIGTSNWSLSLYPGSYNVSVQSQDGAGNLSAATNESIIVTAILTNGNGQVLAAQGATSNLNAVGYPFQPGTSYSLQAVPGTNQIFVSWTNAAGLTILSPSISFTMSSNFVLTANFMSNGLPNDLAFTEPESNAILSTNNFDISGTISNAVAPITVTCQLYSSNSFQAVGPLLTNITSEAAWSINETNIPNDEYQAQVTATDANSNSTVVYEYFTVANLTGEPQSVTVNNASTATFSVTDSNAMSYQWYFNGTNLLSGATNAILTLENVSSTNQGSYTVVIDNSITSAPPAVLQVTNGTIVNFNLSGLVPGAPGTNVQVQLFDHDKPATVQNFLHYIRSGAYTNMFFDRLGTNFVLQGGDYGATDRTNTNPPPNGWDIGNYVHSTNFTNLTPPFPAQLQNEYGLGPQIKNDFGTLAMALQANNSNSATGAFFFNLADNSGGGVNLDGQNFTVFGRVINGTNLLNFLNTLTNGGGTIAPTSFTDLLAGTNITIPGLNDLPVDYAETNAPGNANLLFCDFTFQTELPLDTNAPTVAIDSPPSGEITTNANPIIAGTASDDVGLADVIVVLTPAPDSPDTNLPNGGVALTNYAFGTNWSLTITNEVSETGLLPPGHYTLSAQAQDGAGNISSNASQPLIISALQFIGNGTATIIQNGTNTGINAVGYPFVSGSDYEMSLTPALNYEFANISYNGFTALDPIFPFPMVAGLVWETTFISNGIPNSVAYTSPSPNGIVTEGTVNITGTISGTALPPVKVTSQIYGAVTIQQTQTFTNFFTNAGPPLTTIGMTNWSATVTNLPTGSYAVQSFATDAASNTTVISEYFTVSTNAPLDLNIVGPGTVTGETNGEPVLVGSTFTLTATPNAGQLFYMWSNADGLLSIDPVQTNTMEPGLVLTAIFVSNTLPNSVTITAPLGNVVLSNGDVTVSGTIASGPSLPVTVTCQIFSQTNFEVVTYPGTTEATNAWSFLFNVGSPGRYIAVVEAVDNAGHSTVVTQNFVAFLDGTLPSIAVLSPASNSVVSDNRELAVSGTASDTNGIVSVTDHLSAQAASDGTMPSLDPYVYGFANGTTNWNLTFGLVPPGVYTNLAEALDNAGNTTTITQLVTNTAVLINGNGTVALSSGTNSLPNPIGYPLHYGGVYTLTATPGAGQTFVGWSLGPYNTTTPTVTFTNSEGDLWTATFAPTNAGNGISFTYPPKNARLTTNGFTLKGKMTPAFKSARVTYLVSSLTAGFSVGPFSAANGAGGWSAAVSNLPPDNYIVEAAATNSLGQTTSITELFSVEPFVNAAGTYTGLFICTNQPVAPTNSGFFTFTVAASGLFSGKLQFPAYAPVPIYTQGFQNVDFLSGYYSVTASKVPQSPLTIAINIDLSGASDAAFGTVSSSSNWSSSLVCYRAATKLSTNSPAAPGKYILSLQTGNQTNVPSANGYAAIAVTAKGSAALSGALPDDTPILQSARVSTNGVWPVYLVPSGDGKSGLLIGWQTNAAAGSSSGQLYWYKAPGIGHYATGGIGVSNDLLLTSIGTNYIPPAKGGQFAIQFQGGTILSPLTNSLLVTNDGRWVVTGGAPDKLKISLSASGVISGMFVNTNDNKTLSFKGAFISASQGGSGFIPDAGGQIGSFDLTPLP